MDLSRPIIEAIAVVDIDPLLNHHQLLCTTFLNLARVKMDHQSLTS